MIESLICDISVKEKEVSPDSISNWKEWLNNNWLEELEKLKHYFIE